ncbi:MAG: tyrosine-type recombinase/integrase [Acidimicrobiia bacterium]|nr:tyrosine-type recombinase/integrase [Acidimicrobiia bacterium]
MIDRDLVLSPRSVVATPGGRLVQRKDIGFSDAALEVLVERAAKLKLPDAVAVPGTVRVRNSHLSVWAKFTATHGLPALPSTPEAVGFFAASRADRGLRPSYIRSQVTTIRAEHEKAGLVVAGLTELADEVLDAYSRSDDAPGTRRAPVLTRADLAAMSRRTIEGDTSRRRFNDAEQRGARERLVVTVGYAGAMRIDDLRRAHLEDVEEAPWGLLVRLRSSKDNRRGDSAEAVVVLRRDDELDPVSAFAHFLRVTGLTAGLLVPASFVPPSPHPASHDAIIDRLQLVAAAAGVGVVPGGHSLRRSWATHAFEAGVDLVTIQRHLRHTKVTDTSAYVELLTPWIHNPARDLADSPEGSAPAADRTTTR